MPSPLVIHCMLEISALNDVSPEAERWLNAPKPAAGDTGRDAMRYYTAWMRILLLDIAMFDDGLVLTFEGCAEILGCDVTMIEAALAHLRRDDRERPPLTEADFARVAKSN